MWFSGESKYLSKEHNSCIGLKCVLHADKQNLKLVITGDKVPDLSGIPDSGLCSCLVSGLGL